MTSFGTPVKNNNNNNELVVKKRRSTSTKGTPTHKLRKFVISNNKDNEIYSSSSNIGNSKLIAKILTGKSSKKIVLHQKPKNGDEIKIEFGIDDVSKIEVQETALKGGSQVACKLLVDSLPRPSKSLPKIFNEINDDDDDYSSIQIELLFLGRDELNKFHNTINERSDWLREHLVISPSPTKDENDDLNQQLSQMSINNNKPRSASYVAEAYIPLIVRIVCLTDDYIPFNIGTGFFVDHPNKKDGTKCICTAKHVVSRIENGIEQVKHIFIGVSESIDQPPRWKYNVNMNTIIGSKGDVAVMLLHEYIMETTPESNITRKGEQINIITKSNMEQFQQKMKSFKGIKIYENTINNNIAALESVILGGFPGVPLQGQLKKNISFLHTNVSGMETNNNINYIKLQPNATGGDSGSPVISLVSENCIGVLSMTKGNMDYAETYDTINACLLELHI